MARSAGEKNPSQSLQGLISLIAAFALAFAPFVIAAMAGAGLLANEAALQRDQGLIENALDRSIARVLSEQKSVAWWDESYQHIVQTFDKKWVDEEIGNYLGGYGHDELYIVSDQNRIVYSDRNGAMEMGDSGRSALLQPLVNAVRGPHAELNEHPDLFRETLSDYTTHDDLLESAKWDGHILTFDGRPAIVTAISIEPKSNRPPAATIPYLLISVVFIDDAFIRAISNSLLIPDLTLSEGARASGSHKQAFVTDEGIPAGMLSWTPRAPGSILLTVILPLVGLGLVGSGIFTAAALRRLRDASADLSRSEADAAYRSRHDPLSGLPNRPYFAETLKRALEADGPHDQDAIEVAYLDIDRFKGVNDTLGHKAGDELIKAVAVRLRQAIRRDDFLARFGGDEFAILRTRRDGQRTGDLAARLLKAFATPISFIGQQVPITASIGLVTAPEHGSNIDDLMRNADIALYKAKSGGRSRAVAFSTEMGREVLVRRAVEVDLRQAIDSDGLDLWYQPIVSAETKTIVGVEALLRWRHPTQGYIPPSTFVPLAEEAGLMPALGAWVVERAFADHALWPEIQTAVNLSAEQFRHGDLDQFLREAALRHGVETSRIALEITESVMLESSPRVRETLSAIREAGFKIALDDFGTGYASLTYLREFQFDKLKIDRSFVSEVLEPGGTRQIVQAIVSLGRSLGLSVVAEGVETEEQSAIMRLFGSTELQGYLYSKPLERTSCEELLRKQRTPIEAWEPGSGQARA